MAVFTTKYVTAKSITYYLYGSSMWSKCDLNVLWLSVVILAEV